MTTDPQTQKDIDTLAEGLRLLGHPSKNPHAHAVAQGFIDAFPEGALKSKQKPCTTSVATAIDRSPCLKAGPRTNSHHQSV